jgi:hypothetical protein
MFCQRFSLIPIALAPLRLGGKNIRFRLSSDRRLFAQASQNLNYSNMNSTKLRNENHSDLRVFRFFVVNGALSFSIAGHTTLRLRP